MENETDGLESPETENTTIAYQKIVRKLKREFDEFFRLCESGVTTRRASFLARKKSLELRALLKDYRPISIRHDKRVKRVFEDTKTLLRRTGPLNED